MQNNTAMAAAFESARRVDGTHVNRPVAEKAAATITMTVEEYEALKAAAQPKAQAPATKPVSRPVEDRIAFKVLQGLKRGVDKTLDLTTVGAVATNVYLADHLVPDTLSVTSRTTGKVGGWLTSFANASAKKAEAMRPVATTGDIKSQLGQLSKAQLIELIAASAKS